MKIRVAAVGKVKSVAMASLVDDYAGRIVHYIPFELVVVKNDKALKLDARDFLIVCDEHGDETASSVLAEFIAQHQRAGTSMLVFFMGDATGVSKELKARARTTLSLSRMTFPHELARVVLLEQIYRACTILRGEKYHYG